MTPVAIQRDEQFPHLSKAPIVEAIVELRTRAGAEWAESIIPSVKAALPEYPTANSLHTSAIHIAVGPGQPSGTPPPTPQTGWLGVHLRTEDTLRLARLERDAFGFSQLAPYANWTTFETEALRLWEIHRKLANPSEVQRIGLRFINRIEVPIGTDDLAAVLTSPPKPVAGLALPIAGFIHSETLLVPGHDYVVQLNKTIQPPTEHGCAYAVIIDIDVSSPGGEKPLAEIFADMRWLKNKVFFSSITPHTLELLK